MLKPLIVDPEILLISTSLAVETYDLVGNTRAQVTTTPCKIATFAESTSPSLPLNPAKSKKSPTIPKSITLRPVDVIDLEDDDIEAKTPKSDEDNP